MTLLELYQNATRRFKDAGIPDAGLEASIMLAHLLNVPRAELFFPEKIILPDTAVTFEEYVSRRLQREPLCYILGEQEFWSLPFKVTPDVLIPRPETENMIEICLQVERNSGSDFCGKILDMGTGSGVIAIVLARELPGADIVALDISWPALCVARENSRTHKVDEDICFVQSDWLGGIKNKPVFDLVLSNPPYVEHDIFPSLQPEINFEPKLALDGGSRGIAEIKRFADLVFSILLPGGWFFMEIGADQADLVINLFSGRQFENINIYEDYAGLPRVFQAGKPDNPDQLMK